MSLVLLATNFAFMFLSVNEILALNNPHNLGVYAFKSSEFKLLPKQSV